MDLLETSLDRTYLREILLHDIYVTVFTLLYCHVPRFKYADRFQVKVAPPTGHTTVTKQLLLIQRHHVESMLIQFLFNVVCLLGCHYHDAVPKIIIDLFMWHAIFEQ